MLSPYLEILRHPGAAAFTAAAFVARLPISMIGLGIVLLVSSTRGSYGEAGLLTAAFAVSAALLAPIGARFVDRWGQRPVVIVLVVVHASALLTLVFGTVNGWPLGLLTVIAAVTGASQPAVGSLVRARWAALYPGSARMRTAFAWESILDELIFVIGPPLATILAVAVAPAAPLLTAALLVLAGSLLLVAQRRTEPARRPIESVSRERLATPALAVIVMAMIAIGAVFGSIEVVTVAAADEAGARSWAGLVLALYAAGSMTTGIIVGARVGTRLVRSFTISAVILAVITTPFPFVSGIPALSVTAFLAGMAVSPVLITGFALVEHVAPTGRLTEALTWAGSGIGLGLAGSAAMAGAIVDVAGSRAGYVVTAVAGVATALVAALGWPILRRADRARVATDSGESGQSGTSAPAAGPMEHNDGVPEEVRVPKEE